MRRAHPDESLVILAGKDAAAMNVDEVPGGSRCGNPSRGTGLCSGEIRGSGAREIACQ